MLARSACRMKKVMKSKKSTYGEQPLAKNSKDSKLPKEKNHVIDHYTDLFFLQTMPVTEAFIDRVASDMIAWSKKDTSLRITDFFNELGIPNAMLYKWMKKWPNLQHAHTYTMSVIAGRRDVGAITKKYDGAYIKDSQAMYDPEYKAFLEWRAGLNKDKDMVGNIKVVIEKFPEPKVKE